MANIKVAVRARPLLSRELESQSPIVLDIKGQSTILFKSEAAVAVGEMRDASKEFIYDHSYWSVSSDDSHFASQEQIFSDLGHHILNSAFEGYNGCIFAYGQTGSGKTYTMMGNEQSPGLIPRICDGLFKGMKKNPNQVSYKVEVSYMEIYNEKVRDLLKMSVPSSNSPQHNLKVREHPKEGPYVENLSRHQVSDYQAIEELISIGNSFRVTAATKMNDVSSRSHAIFTITFMQAKYSHDIPSETVSKIHLVDLAGSERASQTGAEGQRLKEGGNINKSLVCLGNVIQALAEASSSSKKKNRFIPYRDSTLTWLLKDSLGGNSKTIMIATVSPCQYSYAETLSTLRYASRAKNIVNKPKINEDENVKLIRELREEIKRLMGIISNTDVESTLHLAVDLHNKEEKIQSLTRSWAGKWGDIQKIIEERDLALRSEGVKMTVASEQPHLLGVDEDRFGAGVVLYYLKSGDTTIGHVDAPIENDISFKSESIANFHCKITLLDYGESVYLHKLEGLSFVNQIPVEQDEPVKLSHSDTLKLGSNTYLRFNNPQEAMKLKEEASPMGTNNNTSNGSFASAVWSPLMNTSSNSLIQTLEQERDALRKRQEDIEHEYEDK
ncbi:PREDICTED: kinesin-like protein KIF16B, partial [Amphimedon queenslandica]|uniref:Kinesin-like protein n=2 Tax=Amphimedon queenslandica TaxID=400682 RepID=A0AAN0K4X6_AMPQE